MNDNETAQIAEELLETAENQPGTPPEQPETDPLAARAKELEGQVADLKDKFLRQAAEFENFKKRTARESLEMRQTAGREILAALLPILDDFDRAAQHGTLGEGVQLVHNKLQALLQQRGLRAMESTGAAFDADQHEAITEIPAPAEDMKGKVIDTVEKGYFLNDKIIRFAKVVVGK